MVKKTLEYISSKLKTPTGQERYYPVPIRAEKHNAKERHSIMNLNPECYYCQNSGCGEIRKLLRDCAAEARGINNCIQKFDRIKHMANRENYFPKVYEEKLMEQKQKIKGILTKFDAKIAEMNIKTINFYSMSNLISKYIISLVYRILIGREREPSNFNPKEEVNEFSLSQVIKAYFIFSFTNFNIHFISDLKKAEDSLEALQEFYNNLLNKELEAMYIRYTRLANYYENNKEPVFFRNQILKILVDTEIFCHIPKDESMLLELSEKHSLVAKFRFSCKQKIEIDVDRAQWTREMENKLRLLQEYFLFFLQEYNQIWRAIKHYQKIEREIKNKNRPSSNVVLYNNNRGVKEPKFCFSLNEEITNKELESLDHEEIDIWTKRIIKKNTK